MTLLEWILAVLTLCFGGLNLWQFVFWRAQKKKINAEADSVSTDAKRNELTYSHQQFETLKNQVETLQEMLADSQKARNEESIKNTEETVKLREEVVDLKGTVAELKMMLSQMQQKLDHKEAKVCEKIACEERINKRRAPRKATVNKKVEEVVVKTPPTEER